MAIAVLSLTLRTGAVLAVEPDFMRMQVSLPVMAEATGAVAPDLHLDKLTQVRYRVEPLGRV